MNGHVKDGIAHGIGAVQFFSGKYKHKFGLSHLYVGTFLNGVMHGYGKLLYFPSKIYYQGEFLNGVPHGFGKWVEPPVGPKSNNKVSRKNDTELKIKEGFWEFGSFVP